MAEASKIVAAWTEWEGFWPTRNPAIAALLAAPRHTLILDLPLGMCIVPGAPESWTASGHAVVHVERWGWDGSFHAPNYRGGFAVCRHHHLGTARRALRAFEAQFVRPTVSVQWGLRRMVRSGD